MEIGVESEGEWGREGKRIGSGPLMCHKSIAPIWGFLSYPNPNELRKYFAMKDESGKGTREKGMEKREGNGK